MTSNKIIVKEASIDIAIQVHASIPEFDEQEFESRYKDKQHVILIAYLNDQPIGYMISYDRYQDGSIYCWMTGVNPKFRGQGALKQLMKHLEIWSEEKGLHTIRIKTRNNRREMLSYLVKNGFMFTEIEPHPTLEENRILLQKPIRL